MIVKVTPQRKEPEIKAQPWEIERTVELPPGEFRYFKEHLLRDQSFIAEYSEEMHMDSSGITHGMLVLCEGIDDGILVNSEGFAYARYAACLSGARTLSLMNRYPALQDFCVYRFLDELNAKRPTSMDTLESIWYNGRSGRNSHYDESRYHGLNLHSVFSKGTIDYSLNPIIPGR